MRREMGRVWSCRILWLLFLLAATLLNGRAEQLPIRIYTTADGLPRDNVSYIKQDSRGFLWVFTGDGLTRFDGYNFITYTTDDGLPHSRVNKLLETRNGVYWLATAGGLCRFNPRGSRLPNAGLGTLISASRRRSEQPHSILPHPRPAIPTNQCSSSLIRATRIRLFRFTLSGRTRRALSGAARTEGCIAWKRRAVRCALISLIWGS